MLHCLNCCSFILNLYIMTMLDTLEILNKWSLTDLGMVPGPLSTWISSNLEVSACHKNIGFRKELWTKTVSFGIIDL